LRGPIGLDLVGRAPAETALAIMSEVVATRFGGSGRPLRDLAIQAEDRHAREPQPPAAVGAR
jgi:xanthine dehydrogenase accessory factor